MDLHIPFAQSSTRGATGSLASGVPMGTGLVLLNFGISPVVEQMWDYFQDISENVMSFALVSRLWSLASCTGR